MLQVIETAPVWLWMLAAAALSAATVWLYYRCVLAEDRSAADAALADRAVRLAEAQNATAARPSVRAPEAAFAFERAAQTAPQADSAETEALKQRVWALEGRLRDTIDAAQSGAPVDAAALSASLTTDDDGTPPREISKLKFDAWRLEERLAEGQDGDGDATPSLDPDLADGVLVTRVGRLQHRLERALDAARRGDLAELVDIETEQAADGEGRVETPAIDFAAAPAAAPFADGQLPPEGVDPSSLRYRVWSLSGALRSALDDTAAGHGIDRARLERILAESAQIDASAVAATAAVDSFEFEPDAEAAWAAERAELLEERAGLQDAASQLRYQVWSLSRRLGDVLSVARAGEAVDPDRLVEDLEADDLVPTDGPTERAAFLSAGVFAVRDDEAVETARADAAAAFADERLAAERRIEAERAALAEARAETASLRGRVWTAEWRLASALEAVDATAATASDAAPEIEALTAEKAAVEHALESADEQTRVLADDAAALRTRLAQAEAALRDARAETAQYDSAARTLAADLATLSARQEPAGPAPSELRLASRLEDEAAAKRAERSAAAELRARLWAAEWRLRDAEAREEHAANAAAERAEQALQGDWAAERAALMSARDADMGRLAAELETARTEAARAAETRAQVESGLRTAEDRAEALRAELDAARSQASTAAAALAAAEASTADALSAERRRLQAAESRAEEAAAELSEAKRQAEEAERRADELAAELDAARRSAQTAAADAARPDPRLAAEVETLRTRLRRLEGDAAAAPSAEDLTRARRDADALRSRLAETEAELARLRSTTPQVAPAASFSAVSAPEPTPQPAEPVRAVAQASSVAAPRAQPTDGGVDAPLSGVEAAAAELIDARAVVAVSNNRPTALLEDAPDATDDLTRIRGVDANRADALRDIGVHRFRQFAEFSPRDLAWIDDRLQLRGGLIRDRWLPQALALAAAERTPSQAVETAVQPSADAGAGRLETVDSEPPHPLSAPASGPLWGVEAAALERIEDSDFAVEPGRRPLSFAAASRSERLDDLTAILGVGQRLQAALRAEGARTYAAIADLTADEAAWLDRRLGLDGRVVRDRWIPQARRLADAPRPASSGDAPSAAATPRVGSEPVAPPEPAAPPVPAVQPTAADREAEAAALAASGAVLGAPDEPAGGYWAREDKDAGAASDDLKLIVSVGPKMEARLNGLGLMRFEQLAEAPADALAWLDLALGLGGRLTRERWAAQAEALAERKRAGQLAIGPEGVWTTRDGLGEDADAAAAAASSELTPTERAGLRLIQEGFSASTAERPSGLLSGPTGASPDDLKLIAGVSAAIEGDLNGLGVYYYRQIAAFTAADIAWFDATLRLGGRVVRDRWVAQAAALQRRRWGRG